MEEIGVKLQKAVLIMMSIVSMLGMSSCEDRLDSPCPSTGEGKTVEVSLCVGLADWEDAAALSTRSIHTEANEGFGFDVRLFSGQNMGTKAITVPEDPLATAKPDKLYGLEIWQYDRAGNCINNSTQNLGNKSIGESFTVPLVDPATLSTPETECQLLIVARGYNGSKNTIESLKGKRLSDIQDMMLDSSVINSITTKDQIKVMPYLLLLPHVCIVKEGETYPRLITPFGFPADDHMGKRLEKHGICLETSYASIHTCQLPIIASSGGQGDISLFTGSILYLAGSRCRGVGQLYLLDPQCATRRKPECHVPLLSHESERSER